MAICTPHMKKPILSNNYSNKLVVSYLPLALFDKGPENHSVGVWQRLTSYSEWEFEGVTEGRGTE